MIKILFHSYFECFLDIVKQHIFVTSIVE